MSADKFPGRETFRDLSCRCGKLWAEVAVCRHRTGHEIRLTVPSGEAVAADSLGEAVIDGGYRMAALVGSQQHAAVG